MTTTRSFDGMTDRYRFDFGSCTPKNGYAQIDTGQDASYYGSWTNPFKLVIFNYCEGDMTLQEADTVEEYTAAIRELVEWHRKGGYWLGIDGALNPELIARFTEIGLADLLH